MKQELSQHRLAYAILILGMTLITIAFLGVWPDRWLQRGVILIMVVFYTLWGTVTHLHADRVTKRVISEYACMSLLAGVLLLLVTTS
jgi:hypothetical protein